MADALVQNYSQAFFGIAQKKQKIDRLQQDIAQFLDLAQRYPSLLATLQNPTTLWPQKENLLHLLAPLFQKETHHFLLLIAKKGRAALLIEIAEAFLALCKKHQKIHVAHITSAYPLSKASQTRLTALVQKMVHSKKVELNYQVDPKIIGGYLLHLEGHCLDASLRTRLRQLLKRWTPA